MSPPYATLGWELPQNLSETVRSQPPLQQQQQTQPQPEPDLPPEHPQTPSTVSETSTESTYFLTPRIYSMEKGPKILIRDLIAGHYTDAWSCWSKFPEDLKTKLFNAWKGKYSWDPENEVFFDKQFGKYCSKWLRNNLYNARNLHEAPFRWITPEIWQKLKEEWNSEDFKKKSAQNKANRENSGESATLIYHGGSVSVAVHEDRMEKEMGRKPTPKESFVRTHTSKSGQLDLVAQKMVAEFDEAMQMEIDSGKEESSINQEAIWREKFPQKKGIVRGRGNMVDLESNKYATSSSSSASNKKTQVLEAKVETLQTELERSRTENAANATILSNLIATLAAQGIDVSQVVRNAASVVPDANASQSNVGAPSLPCKRRREVVDDEAENEADYSPPNNDEGDEE